MIDQAAWVNFRAIRGIGMRGLLFMVGIAVFIWIAAYIFDQITKKK